MLVKRRHPDVSARPVAERVEGPLADRTYRRLLSAQVASLLGTGLTTIALSLLAYDLAGGGAGSVLGIALALKMVAYIGVSPVAAALTQQLDRRRLLISLDVARAGVVALMPFVSQVWQVYVLIFVLNACAAVFTPAFQAVIPQVLPDEEQYTKALSFSRIAYELENLLSPALAALLLTIVSYDVLFLGDGVTFLISAALVATTALPAAQSGAVPRTFATITRGVRRYFAVAELRALFALDLAVAAASAMVIVNTVVFVRDEFDRGQGAVALALGAVGAGSLIVAIALPALLRRIAERPVLLLGATLLPAGLVAAALLDGFGELLVAWFVIGLGLAVVQTPAGRLVQRAVRGDDGPQLFAAQFALSHACWLVTYPLAGIVGHQAGLQAAALLLAAIAAASILVAWRLWTSLPSGPAAAR